MENKDKQPLSLGAEFEAIEGAPAAATAPAASAAAAPGAPMPMRRGLAIGSIGLLVAIAGLLGDHPAIFAGAQAGIAAYLVFELLRSGLLRLQPTSRPHAPLAGGLAVLGGALGLIPGGAGESAAWAAPCLAILGGLLALAAPSLAKQADAKLPPPPPEAPLDPQFSRMLLGNLLILAGVVTPWTTAARGSETVLGAILLVLCVLAITGAWIGMTRSWAMPAVSGGALGMSLLLAPVEGLVLGAFGAVRVFKGDAAADSDSLLGNLAAAWPGESHPLAHGLPVFLTIAASAWALMTVVQGTMKGVEAQKKRKEEEVAARKAARAAAGAGAPVPAANPSGPPPKA